MLEVFDVKLKETIYKLPFDKILTLKNVSGTLPAWPAQLPGRAREGCFFAAPSVGLFP